MYAMRIYALITHFYPEQKIILRNNELVAGMSIAFLLACLLEIPAWLASCFTWTVYTSNAKGTFLAVWLPQLCLFTTARATLVNTYFHFGRVTKHNKEKDKHDIVIPHEGSHNRCIRCCNDTLQLRSFISDLHVLLCCLLVSGILYRVIPAFILIIAYPNPSHSYVDIHYGIPV